VYGTAQATHTYGDDSGTEPYAVTVTVEDDDGDADTASFPVTVENRPPVVTAPTTMSTTEGAELPLSATFSDPGYLDTHTATVDWGDGNTTTDPKITEPNSPDGSVEATHTYADNGEYTVTLTVTDDEGETDMCEVIVTVDNVAPIVDAGPDRTVNEGEIITLQSSFVDPGILDEPHTAVIEWGDGTTTTDPEITEPNSPDGSVEATHAYKDDGTYTAEVTVTDKDGDSHTDSIDIVVENLAPVFKFRLDITGDGTVPEGEWWSISGGDNVLHEVGFADAGDDTHTATIDWGDGTSEQMSVTSRPTNSVEGTLTASHAYPDDRIYDVVITLTDDDGGTAELVFGMEATNVAPEVDIDDLGIDRFWDVLAPLSGLLSDPGAQDTHSIEWDLGDGTVLTGGTELLAIEHAYALPGSYEVGLTATDDDGGVGFDTTVLTVLRRPAVLTIDDTMSDATADYSDPAFVSATLVDAIDGIGIEGAEVLFEIGAQTVAATTDPDGRATTMIVLDQPAGDCGPLSASFAGDALYLASTDAASESFVVTHETVTLEYLGDVFGQRDEFIHVAAQLVEDDDGYPGDLAGKTVSFTLDGGETEPELIEGQTNAGGLADIPDQVRLLSISGLYTMTSAFDGDAYYQAASDQVPFTVWEAIPGLKVTGGGWLTRIDPVTAEGDKCTFGFNAKYTNDGSGYPVGEFQMRDHGTRQRFAAEGFDWLILTAEGVGILQGSCTIDGEGGHTFRMWITDEGTPGKGADTFELWIDGVPYVGGTIEAGNIMTR
jgi:PKD repeat protein